MLSFAVLTLAGSLLVTALHLPAGGLRWAGLIVLFLAGLGLVVPAVQRVLQLPFTRLPQPDAARAAARSSSVSRSERCTCRAPDR